MSVSSPQPTLLFQAPWPESLDPTNRPLMQRALDITIFALQIIFAPVYVAYLILKKIASYAILPSHHLSRMTDPQEEARIQAVVQARIVASNHIQSRTRETRCSFETPDGAKIDGFLVRSRQETIASSKVILCPMPNAMRYEEALEFILPLFRGNRRALQATCVDPNISVFLFNYRGVGRSTGSPYTDKLPLDVYSAYDYLISEHDFLPQDVVLFGCSMGGATGAIGASWIQEKYGDVEISAVADSTFSDLSTEVSALASYFVGPSLARPAALATQGLGLDLRVAEAWDRLRGYKAALHNRRDPVVPHEASLTRANVQNSGNHTFNGFGHGLFMGPHSSLVVEHLRRALRLT